MTMVRTLILVVIALPACGDDEAGPADTKTSLTLCHNFADTLMKGAHESGKLLVNAIYGATRLAGTGRTTNTGTVTMTAAGGWVYKPKPADRLVVKMAGLTQEFRVLDARGNMDAATPEDWLGGNHVLNYRHSMDGILDVEVRRSSTNGRISVELKGTTYYDKRPFETRLKAAGTYSFQRDLAGYDYRTAYKLTGSLMGKVASVVVDEDHKFRLIAAQGPSRRPRDGTTTGGRSRVVTWSDDTIRNRLTLGPDTYKWNAHFVKDFVNGRPAVAQPTSWRCRGTIMKNGKDWGNYAMDAVGKRIAGKLFSLRTFVLKTPEGKTIIQAFP